MKTAKRFYKGVTTEAVEGGFGVFLDGRRLKTPGKTVLVVTSDHLAGLIAAEWDAQIDHIKPETMPVTRLVNVTLELTPHNRDKLAAEARQYAGTDLLCYRAEKPVRLAQRQEEHWDPVLDWARGRGIDLEATDTVIAVEQPQASLDAVAVYAAGLDDLYLTLFVHLTAVYGSAILSMAVLERHISGSRAFEVSRLDNLFQIEQWGEDEEAAEITANLAVEINDLCKILES